MEILTKEQYINAVIKELHHYMPSVPYFYREQYVKSDECFMSTLNSDYKNDYIRCVENGKDGELAIKREANYIGTDVSLCYEDVEIKPTECPCCHKHDFKRKDSHDICPICGWRDNEAQRKDCELKNGENEGLSLDEYVNRWFSETNRQ